MEKVMVKRLISVCFVVIIVFSIFDCAQTTEDSFVAETETVETGYTEAESEEEADAEDTETENVVTKNTEAESKEEAETAKAENAETEVEEELDAEDTETAIVEEECVRSGEEITLQTQSNAIDHMWRECDLTQQEWPD